jgi:myosin heavy subunit
MSKFLFYLALILIVGATVLGYLNDRRLNDIIASKEATIQKQDAAAAGLEKEFKELQESVASQTAVQDKNKKELSDAQEAQAKAANDLTQAQNQLADKEAELTKIKNDLSVKASRIQELEAALQFLSQPKEASKSKNPSNKEKGTHAELKKESTKNDVPSKEIGASCQEGSVVAINTTWNFVVISIGSQDGMAAGTEISIKRHDQVIAKAKVTSVEASTSVADLVMSTLAAGTTVQVGDPISVSEKEIGK